jgi:hypothetical protein
MQSISVVVKRRKWNQVANSERRVEKSGHFLGQCLEEEEQLSVLDKFAELLRFRFAHFSAGTDFRRLLPAIVLSSIETGNQICCGHKILVGVVGDALFP